LGEIVVSRLFCTLRLQGNCHERNFFYRLQTESLGLLRWHRWRTSNIASCGLTEPVRASNNVSDKL
jgi:hypothetical protein